jgi:hypothetical protein
MEARTERLARNEVAFRALNERAKDVTEELAFDGMIDVPDTVECVCECANPDCMARVRVARGDYELARGGPAQFIVAPGHDLPDIERTVFEGDGFAIVEKHPGERAIAVETDPRS